MRNIQRNDLFHIFLKLFMVAVFKERYMFEKYAEERVKKMKGRCIVCGNIEG